MKIEVNKNELERALIALGKLISRMSPVPEHKSLLIECRDNKICFKITYSARVHHQNTPGFRLGGNRSLQWVTSISFHRSSENKR